MKKDALITLGKQLSEELLQLSETYHLKADSRDILGYEASCILERCDHLSGKEEKALKESTLLSSWGEKTRELHPKIMERVLKFYKEFEKQN